MARTDRPTDTEEDTPREVRPGMVPAIRLYFRTLGYALPALLHVMVFSLISIAFVCVIGGLTWVGMEYIHKYVGIGLAIATVIPFALLWMPYADRKMFRVSAGHIVVFTELIGAGKTQAEGKGLFSYGRQVVADRFGDGDSFYGFHDQLRSMFGHLIRTLDRLDDSIPALETVKKYVRIIQGLLIRHLENLVLSFAIAAGSQGEEELEKSSIRGTCYIMQNGLTLLKTAVFAAILERIVGWVSTFFWCIVLAAAIFLYGYLYIFELPLPDLDGITFKSIAPLLTSVGLWISFVAAVIFGALLGHLVTWAFMTAVMRPITTAMVLLKFHTLVASQPLKEEWQARIEEGAFALDRLDWLSFRMLGVGHS
jgi:hypothetical protein